MPATPPSSRRRPARLAVVLGLAAIGALGAWGLVRTVARDEGAAVLPDPSRSPAGLAGAARAAEGLVDVPDPFAPPTEPLPTDAVRAALAHRFEWRRIETLKSLVAVGAASPEVAADLERLRASGSVAEKAWASAALMRVRGTREHVRELAVAAADRPHPTPMEEALLAFDPGAGGAILRALRESRERASKAGASPTPGLEAAIDRLLADPGAGALAVAEGAKSASGDDFQVWLRVAQALRPVPAAALQSTAARLAGPDGPDRLAALAFLAQPATDLSAADASVADALLRALEAPRKPKQPLDAAALRAIARLPRLDPTALDRLVALSRAGPDDLRSVLLTLTRAGPAAARAAPALLALAPGVAESLRPYLADALAATGAPEVEAYALERLKVAAPAEREAWIRRLGPAKDPAAVVAVVGADLSSGKGATAALAADALSRVDPGVKSPETADLLARALKDARAPVRVAAILSVGRLTQVPEALVDALAPALDGPPGPERAAATAVLLDAARRGPAAAPFVPSLLRLATRTDPSADPETPGKALRALAAVDPRHPGAREAFRGVLASPGSEDARRAALWGLSRLAVPAPEDRAAVQAAKADPKLAAAAAEVLARPAWR